MSKKADVLQQKSPAEFFAENKNIAGFDNVHQQHALCLTHQADDAHVLKFPACVIYPIMKDDAVSSRASASTRQ